MADREQNLQDTLRGSGREPHLARVHQLIVIKGGRAEVHLLPAEGAVLLGRSSFADIMVDDPSISRRHAILRIDGARTTIEDLSSANGVRVGRSALDPGAVVDVMAGDTIELGSVTVVLSSAKDLDPEAELGFVLADRKMKEIRDLIERVAPSHLSVLLLGETGVGKEVIAKHLHERSGRTGPFLELNCAALSETLLESELFGHEEGAFTGASRAKEGLLESAQGGTVLIDEVGELPANMQVKLLRVLESKQVTRIGALRPKSIDVRFVAATNRELEREVEADRFRRDLFFRLAGITISIPPLRDRPAEIELLARSFLRASSRERGVPEPKLSQAALQMLHANPWPGNVRELKSTIERAVLLAKDEILPEHLSAGAPSPASRAPAAPPASEPRSLDLRAEVAAVERDAILDALDRSGGNQSEAAKMLGISRRTLGTRMDTFGITRPRKKTS